MPKTFLGLSPFFHLNAEGHYERVHLAMLKSLEALNFSPPSPSRYFGAKNYPQLEKSYPLIDESFKQPSGKISFSKLVELSKLLSNFAHKNELLIYVYEGSISFILALKLLSNKSVPFKAIINLHQVDLFENILNDRFVSFAYRRIINSGLSFSSNFIITSESFKSAEVIGAKLNLKLEVFPVFSTFSKPDFSINYDRSDLILFSGDFDEKKMTEDLEGISVSGENSIILDSRFGSLSSNEFKNYLTLNNFQVIGGRVSELEYASIFTSVKRVWFLYRSKTNTLGSSGRLMDSLNFGLEVIVPTNSALADFAAAANAKYSLLDMNNYSRVSPVENLVKTNSIQNNLKFNSAYAVQELLRLWNIDPNFRLKSKESYFRRKSSGLIAIYVQWLGLQIALFALRIKNRVRRFFN